MWSIDRRVGKLVEIRIWSPVTLEETVPWGEAHDSLVSKIDGPYVCLVDLVDATVFPQDVVEGYVKTMKNEKNLVRTGTILNKSPTIREADNPNRRAFRDPDELFEWLSEVLDAKERARLREILGLGS